MQRYVYSIVLLAATAAAQNTVVPNTTLAAQTANNTSAANNFAGTRNGNMSAGSVSKADVRNLLYNGSTTRVFAHLMGWFGNASHVNVGYDSSSQAQVSAQVADMMSRGISGAVLDWYGPNNAFIDASAKALKNAAEVQSGAFTFAIMEDAGSVRACVNTAGCDVTQAFINDLNYATATYASSPSYLRINGRAVFFTFGTETLPIDWSRVAQSVSGNPAFIFENTGGFSLPMNIGAFGWVQPQNATAQDPMSLNYLTDFYWNSTVKFPNSVAFGATYKGFDDSIAAWGSNRLVTQNCGQTWMQTFARIGQYYSASNQLPFLQLVTWNDYEEGTAIESGIDNCVAVSGSVNAGMLNWSISGGQENTIDHYSVFISKDGTNLMKLTDVSAGQHNLNLASYNFAAGSYAVFVKAWGQPSITNKMSGAIGYVIAGAVPTTTPNPPPTTTPNPTPTVKPTPVPTRLPRRPRVTARNNRSSVRSNIATTTVVVVSEGSPKVDARMRLQ